MLSQNLNLFKPRKPLGLGHYDLPHVGDLTGDYFITVGCSSTDGSAMDYKETWSHKLGELMNMEHINLGWAGSSLEWGYRIIKRLRQMGINKKIFWMQTHPIRSHRWMLAPLIGDRRARMIDILWDDPRAWLRILEFYNMVKDLNVYVTNSWFYTPTLKLLINSKICKKDPRYFFNDHEPVDYARDNEHAGAQSHTILIKDWYDHLTKHFADIPNNK